ncbi:hypothetical protein CRG98_029782 [Punica granatum]|uniref:Uncharacterized protein n=1 Tax=Punica granatum TaxID=22663 RepID=A0A2I0J0Q0_PUNGR|nr:hypothetical protein CRG98_029782 [Punica granatum]
MASYRLFQACSTHLSLQDPVPRASRRTVASAYPHPGKYNLYGPQSRSAHSRMVMTWLPKLSVLHARHPISRMLDEGTSHGYASHGQREMHGFTPPRKLCRALHFLLRQGKGPTKRYPLLKLKTETIKQTL